MKITIEPGRYVVAVSGGVDSVVLLDVLAKSRELRAQSRERRDSRLSAHSSRLMVAHFDHGIRPDSKDDRLFVQKLAKDYGLPFVYAEGRLGADASEDTARRARYAFLHETRRAAGADAVVTAHHQDDVLETAVLNIIRGTGRKGLTSLRSTDAIQRPLLDMPKQILVEYAREHRLQWHEDSTNESREYLRNYVRHEILPKFTPDDRRRLLAIIDSMRRVNDELDAEIALLSEISVARLNRTRFILLPHDVSREVMAAWLRANGVRDFDRNTLERLVRASKIFRPGKRADVLRGIRLEIHKDFLALVHQER